MISTVDSRKVITIELERSELYNLLRGAEMRGTAQVRHKADDVPVDVVVSCGNPESEEVVDDE